MARAIDKDKLITSMAWHDQQGMISSIDDVLDIIEAFPTLTQPNEVPPCYRPDSEGCAYQCYDGQDEPIEKCKECPLCYSDKQRHHAPPNEPLTIEQLQQMDGEPVYIHSDIFPEDCGWRVIAQSDVLRVYFTDGTSLSLTDYKKSWLSYSRPPEGEKDA